jgi:hypothetical protein
MSIFEKISRKKLRFDTSIGPLAAEDLWDLPLTASQSRNRMPPLNDIAVLLHRRIQETTISFVDTDTKADTDLQLRFDIVKHIIDVKKAERTAALEASAKADRRQKLLAVYARKQDAELEEMSQEQILALIDQT